MASTRGWFHSAWLAGVGLVAACATAVDSGSSPEALHDGGTDSSTAGGAGGQGGAAGVCVPGKQEACACVGGVQGVQVCNDQGTGLGVCQCPDGGASGNAGSPGQGGTAGTAGVGGSSGAAASSGAGGTGAAGSAGAGGTSGAGGAGAGGAPGLGGTSGAGGFGGGNAGSGGTSGAGGFGGGSAGSGGLPGTGGMAGATGNPDTCPGALLSLGSLPVVVIDDTQAYSDDFHYMCGNLENGRDVVYQVVAPASGTMLVKVEPQGFSSAVAYSTGGCSPTAVSQCKWGVQIGAVTTLQFAVSAGATYWIYVDGYSLSGIFKMTISM